MSLWNPFRRERRSAPAPFIVGVARSGTTLLRLMLDAHPEISIPPETYFLLPFLRGDKPTGRLGAEEFCRTVCGFHTWPDLGLPAEMLMSEAQKLRPFSLAAGTRLVYRLYAGERGKRRWGDKTPAYRRYMPGIQSVLPEAHFLHIIRDGRDVALSLRAQWFSPAKDVAGLARHWRDEVEEARRRGAECRSYAEVRYEELVTRTRPTLQRMCTDLEVPFDPAMEQYHRGAQARLGEVTDQRLPDGTVITRASRLARHRLAGAPPDESRIGVWRSAMSGGEIATFDHVAGDLLRELGYE